MAVLWVMKNVYIYYLFLLSNFSFFFPIYTLFLFVFDYKQIAELTQHSATPDGLFSHQRSVISLTGTDFRISDNLLPSPAAHLDGQA